jgi:hypothetical protein
MVPDRPCAARIERPVLPGAVGRRRLLRERAIGLGKLPAGKQIWAVPGLAGLGDAGHFLA